jgi:hypothetical protein
VKVLAYHHITVASRIGLSAALCYYISFDIIVVSGKYPILIVKVRESIAGAVDMLESRNS